MQVPILQRINKLSHFLEEILIGGLLASASLILFANVVARYVFNWGVPWAEELVRYEIIWMVFIGGSVAVRKGIHIGIDILATVSPPKTQTVIHLVINAISLLFCVFLTVIGFDHISQIKMSGQVAPALQVPIWIVQMAIPIPIGGSLMALRFLQRLISVWRDGVSDAQLEDLG
ncbi:MAG: C4-dicarboxylate transporter DctQ subunit [Patiriisocius sp.]